MPAVTSNLDKRQNVPRASSAQYNPIQVYSCLVCVAGTSPASDADAFSDRLVQASAPAGSGLHVRARRTSSSAHGSRLQGSGGAADPPVTPPGGASGRNLGPQINRLAPQRRGLASVMVKLCVQLHKISADFLHAFISS